MERSFVSSQPFRSTSSQIKVNSGKPQEISVQMSSGDDCITKIWNIRVSHYLRSNKEVASK